MAGYVGKHRAAAGIRATRGAAAPRGAAHNAMVAVTAVGAVTAASVTPAFAATPGHASGSRAGKAHAVPHRVHHPKAGVKSWHRGWGPQVTRYTASVGYRVNVRTAPTLRTPGTIAAKVPNGTMLRGRYNATGLWFKVAGGRWSGRWVASSLLQKTQNAASINGRLPKRDLVALPVGSKRRGGASQTPMLAHASAHAFNNMNRAFRARFGHDLGVIEGYRSLATQRLYAKQLGYPRAAVPGTSNHGFGNAIDVSEVGRAGAASPFAFGHVYDRWLAHNAWRWGFDRPPHLDKGGSNPEFWHYNFTG